MAEEVKDYSKLNKGELETECESRGIQKGTKAEMVEWLTLDDEDELSDEFYVDESTDDSDDEADDETEDDGEAPDVSSAVEGLEAGETHPELIGNEPGVGQGTGTVGVGNRRERVDRSGQRPGAGAPNEGSVFGGISGTNNLITRNPRTTDKRLKGDPTDPSTGSDGDVGIRVPA